MDRKVQTDDISVFTLRNCLLFENRPKRLKSSMCSTIQSKAGYISQVLLLALLLAVAHAEVQLYMEGECQNNHKFEFSKVRRKRWSSSCGVCGGGGGDENFNPTFFCTSSSSCGGSTYSKVSHQLADFF